MLRWCKTSQGAGWWHLDVCHASVSGVAYYCGGLLYWKLIYLDVFVFLSAARFLSLYIS